MKKAKKSKSNRIIHIAIRNIRPMTNHSVNPSEILISDQQNKSAITSHSLENYQQYRLSSNKSISLFKLPEINCTNDYHQKKKTKWHIRQYLCLVVLLVILMMIIISIVLPIILIKQSHTSTKSISAILRWNTSGITIAIANSLNGPYGFKLDRFGTLYIVEYYGHRITKWLSGASNGTIIAGSLSGLAGNASNEFYNPADIIIEDNGDMYITDRSNDRLQFWPSGNSFGITVAGT